MSGTEARVEPAAACPVPARGYDRIVLGHGAGGGLSADLLRDVFLPAFGNPTLRALEDQASLAIDGARIAVTTDAFVVKPLFFPGGDIGRLAVNGTVNDLAVGGAEPLVITAAFVLEEGLPVADLVRIAGSMGAACAEAGVDLVAGDTKVVDRGRGDGVYVTTTGVGRVPVGRRLSIAGACPGDRVLVSGTLGDHGIAILSVREGIDFETPLRSDTAPLHRLTAAVLAAGGDAVHAMRDPTRGGAASTLHELAEASGVGVVVDETAVPLRSEVRGACELLGLDPLHVANEGKVIAVVDRAATDAVLAAMRADPLGRDAAVIGEVVADHPAVVTVRSALGGERLLPTIPGEQLPRIC